MLDNSAAVWSAIAASFAALSAFLTMLIHRRNLLESLRPELALIGWSRRPEGKDEVAHEVITIQSIKNVGRGTAFNVVFDALHTNNNYPVAIMPTTRLPILASNETIDVAAEMVVWWKNVDESRILPITITIYCWDSRQSRHKTQYRFAVMPLAPAIGMADQVAPGVGLLIRTTTRRSVRWLRMMRRLAKIPLAGRLFRKAADF